MRPPCELSTPRRSIDLEYPHKPRANNFHITPAYLPTPMRKMRKKRTSLPICQAVSIKEIQPLKSVNRNEAEKVDMLTLAETPTCNHHTHEKATHKPINYPFHKLQQRHCKGQFLRPFQMKKIFNNCCKIPQNQYLGFERCLGENHPWTLKP